MQGFPRAATFTLAAGVFALSACASTGSTFKSGVSDRFLEHAPYYTGVRPPLDAGSIVHVPITYQRGGSQSAMFDPESKEGKPIASLLAEMNAYLDSLGITSRLVSAFPGTPPDVHFGCETDGLECTNGPVAPFDPGKPKLRLAVGRASADWTAGVVRGLQEADAAYAVVLTLEVGQYWPQQRGILGKKVVELGTQHEVSFSWLTSLETPVSVLQVTGALVNTDGRVTRIGAEGLLARRTSILASRFGIQALISDQDVEEVRTRQREDLPGKPLAWHVALRTLVGELTGR